MLTGNNSSLLQSEKDLMLEELKEFNARILEDQKRQLENEFDKKFELLMAKFSQDSPSKQLTLKTIKVNRPPLSNISAQTLDETSHEFFEASKHPSTAPHLKIFEGKKQTATIRAQLETHSEPHAIKLSTIDHPNPNPHIEPLNTDSSAVIQIKKNNKLINIPSNLKIYSEPLSKSPRNIMKSSTSKSDTYKPISEPTPVPNVNSNSIDTEYMDTEKHMHFVTRMMVRKSEFLINDANKTITKGKKSLFKRSKSKKYPLGNIDTIDNSLDNEDAMDKSMNKVGRVVYINNDTDDNNDDTYMSKLPQIKKDNSFEHTSPPQNIPSSWLNQRVNDSQSNGHINGHINGRNGETGAVALSMSKPAWENEIAKHILSLYVTSNIVTSNDGTQLKKSTSLLEFADVKRVESTDRVQQYLATSAPHSALLSPPLDHRLRRNRYEDNEDSEEEEEMNAQVDENYEEIEEIKSPVNNNCQKNIKTTTKQSLKLPEIKNFEQSFPFCTGMGGASTVGNNTASGIGTVLTSSRLAEAHDLATRLDKTRKCTKIINKNTGEEVLIRSSSKCHPIWFVSSGEVYSDWTELPGGEKLQAQLNVLYERHHYKEYLGVVEQVMVGIWAQRIYGDIEYDVFLNHRKQIRPSVPRLSKDRTGVGKHKVNPGIRNVEKEEKEEMFWEGLDKATLAAVPSSDSTVVVSTLKDKGLELSEDDLKRLWKQLVLTANAMGVLAIEKNMYEMALEILQKAESWTNRDDYLSIKFRHELRAHVNNTLAFYFYKRGRITAAMSYSEEALKWHDKAGNIEGLVVSYLHIATAQINSVKYKDAHKTTYLILAMLEDGRLAFENATPLQLCLFAIAYHNLAVIQLKLEVPDLACKSSQNARKIARLCLSYSNRWIDTFQRTHDIALDDVKYLISTKGYIEDDVLKIVKTFVDDLYDPTPS